MQKKRIAIYPGTFDPVTFGHIDIMRRALKLFDQVIVAVALNPNKNPLFSLENRVQFIKEATNNLKNLEIISFDNLLIHLAHSKKASVVIKGLRAISDFEFELQMGLMNRTLDEKIETLFMIPSQEFSFLSSNLVKETASHGGDVSKLVPKIVFKELKKVLAESTR
jgi:pantetheine-phosphate adenylyltransferase